MTLINRSPDYRVPVRGREGLCMCDTYTGTENGNCERCGKPTGGSQPISMLGGGRAGELIAFAEAQKSGR